MASWGVRAASRLSAACARCCRFTAKASDFVELGTVCSEAPRRSKRNYEPYKRLLPQFLCHNMLRHRVAEFLSDYGVWPPVKVYVLSDRDVETLAAEVPQLHFLGSLANESWSYTRRQ